MGPLMPAEVTPAGGGRKCRVLYLFAVAGSWHLQNETSRGCTAMQAGHMADDIGVEARLEHVLSRVAETGSDEAATFRTVYADTARREAAASRARQLAGQSLGPLDGMLVSVKDLFDVAGDVTVAGARNRLGVAPAVHDAPAVSRLRAAGAVIVGRTVMTEYAFAAVGTHPYFPAPGNPRDRTRVTGGSSSGAAASVGYGLCDIALGSDTGGSIRIPAALCGLTGFKPSHGVVPLQGAFPLSTTLDTGGPIARSVAACARAFAVLGDRADALATSVAARDLKIGVIRHEAVLADAEAPVLAAFEVAQAALVAAGMTLETVEIGPVIEGLRALDALGMFTSVELAAKLRDLPPDLLEMMDPRIRARMIPGYAVPATTYIAMHEARAALIAQMTALMDGFDGFILPTTPITAPRIVDMQDDAAFVRANGLVLRNPRIGNLLDLPGISLPLPVSGLPVGLMLWGVQGSDDHVLRVARTMEKVLYPSENP